MAGKNINDGGDGWCQGWPGREDNHWDPSSETPEVVRFLSLHHWSSYPHSKSAKLLKDVLQQNRRINQERARHEIKETGILLMRRQREFLG